MTTETDSKEATAEGRKVYLASRYSRFPQMQSARTILEAHGYEVTSRWINGDHQIDDAGLSLEAKAAERTRFATEDWEDLMAADVVISFTEEPRASNSRGGRHVEFGAALAAGKRCIVVGPRENVFHCMPEVEVYKDFNYAVAGLKKMLLTSDETMGKSQAVPA